MQCSSIFLCDFYNGAKAHNQFTFLKPSAKADGNFQFCLITVDFKSTVQKQLTLRGFSPIFTI